MQKNIYVLILGRFKQEEEEEEEKEDEEEEESLVGWRFLWCHQLLRAQILYNTHSCLHITVHKLWSLESGLKCVKQQLCNNFLYNINVIVKLKRKGGEHQL
jgi:hypothetical protein